MNPASCPHRIASQTIRHGRKVHNARAAPSGAAGCYTAPRRSESPASRSRSEGSQTHTTRRAVPHLLARKNRSLRATTPTDVDRAPPTDWDRGPEAYADVPATNPPLDRGPTPSELLSEHDSPRLSTSSARRRIQRKVFLPAGITSALTRGRTASVPAAVGCSALLASPSRLIATQPPSASATASGFSAAILSKARAGPSGTRRPCSQF